MQFAAASEGQSQHTSPITQYAAKAIISTMKEEKANAQLSAWEVLQHLVKFVWPKGNKAIKRRVLVALCLLIGAKVWTFSVLLVSPCGMAAVDSCETLRTCKYSQETLNLQ
ncbi:hypothetical protein ANCDUO_10728 [Ancylostoma duodenale]|uniref:Uncharacterized protein n=1 Tax=Ancylostoma duodenale TaxID=51022 RepID=A0A0C2GJK2_9BILA|nr:hypothetical protein ANCDUO_10728 [Ancylostoma duodenale]